jgi:hypothetical protein
VARRNRNNNWETEDEAMDEQTQTGAERLVARALNDPELVHRLEHTGQAVAAKPEPKFAPPMEDRTDPPIPGMTSDTKPTEAYVAPPEELTPADEYSEAADPEYIKLHRERCRYVKRTGGLRKDLHPTDAARAKAISEQMGLSVDAPWPKVFIDGYMNKPFERNDRPWNDKEAKSRA